VRISGWLSLLALVVTSCAAAGAGGSSPPRRAAASPVAWRGLAHCPANARLGIVAYVRDGALHLIDLNRCRERVLIARGAQAPVGFSADGRWLAVGSRPTILRVDGSTAPAPAFAEPAAQWAWSPRGATLAASGRDRGLRIRAAGGSARVLAPAGFGVESFAWAPSGQRLEVERHLYRGRGGSAAPRDVQQLLAVPLAGGSARLLYRAPRGQIAPPVAAGWSPDSRWAFFWPDAQSSASLAADGMPLRVVSARGGQARTVVGSMLLIKDWIAFCGLRAVIVSGAGRFTLSGKRLVVAGAPSWRPRPLTSAKRLSWVSPACAPDGRRLAVAAGRSQPSFRRLDLQHRSLWLVSLPAGTPRRLTTPPRQATTSDELPRWSADGRYILFLRQGRARHERGDHYDIELVRLEDRRLFGPLARVLEADATAYAPYTV